MYLKMETAKCRAFCVDLIVYNLIEFGNVCNDVCSGSRFNIKMLSYKYRKSHCGDKTAVYHTQIHLCQSFIIIYFLYNIIGSDSMPDSKVHGANMGPTWILSATDGPLVCSTNLAIRHIGEITMPCRLRCVQHANDNKSSNMNDVIFVASQIASQLILQQLLHINSKISGYKLLSLFVIVRKVFPCPDVIIHMTGPQ